MADRNEIVKLAVDLYRGNVQKYSTQEANELLRAALIEANGGSTKLSYKTLRGTQGAQIFALIEEILDATIIEGLQQSDFFNALVDFRNVANGDQNVFVTKDSNLFEVAEMADGTQGIRRQRLGGEREFPITTTRKGVRIYEELDRVLSGRVDFNEMITRVAQSFQNKVLEDVYALWSKMTATELGDAVYFVSTGSYSEADMIDLVSHVEAASNGKTATILGTKKALRTLAPSIEGADSKSDLYNMGLT